MSPDTTIKLIGGAIIAVVLIVVSLWPGDK